MIYEYVYKFKENVSSGCWVSKNFDFRGEKMSNFHRKCVRMNERRFLLFFNFQIRLHPFLTVLKQSPDKNDKTGPKGAESNKIFEK